MDAQALRVLVLNDPAIAQHADEVFKVWPTDRDQPAFRAAMTDGVEIPVDLAASRLAQAHAYFGAQVREWSAEESDFPQSVRLAALVRALRDYLRVVVIDLEPGDNAQVIFETLNHRGSPLLAGDLVKNLLFQVAQAQGADVQSLYEQYWKPLDSDEWRQLVAQGRLYRPRVDQFLNYWLTMKLAEEVPADQIFTTFPRPGRDGSPAGRGDLRRAGCGCGRVRGHRQASAGERRGGLLLPSRPRDGLVRGQSVPAVGAAGWSWGGAG